MEIYVVRHTQIDIPKGTCYGQTDVPLADTFFEEAEQLKQKLPDSFNAVYSSSSKRCVDLAAQLHDDEIVKKDDLKELNFGDWEGKKWNDIDPQALDLWMNDFVNTPAPNGENLADLYLRVKNFLESLRDKHDTRTLIVTHAGVIRCIWAFLLQIDLKHLFKIPIGFGEIFIANVGKNPDEDFIIQKQ